MIVPHWNTAKWWDLLSDLLLDVPLNLGDHRRVLTPNQDHNLPYIGQLVACLLGTKQAYSAGRLQT